MVTASDSEECHGKGKGPSFKTAAHKNCKACHKAKGGPTKCDDCHPK